MALRHFDSNPTLGDSDREWIGNAIRSEGEPQTAKRLGVDRATVLRAYAGLPIQRRTHDYLIRKVDEIRSGGLGDPRQLELPLAS